MSDKDPNQDLSIKPDLLELLLNRATKVDPTKESDNAAPLDEPPPITIVGRNLFVTVLVTTVLLLMVIFIVIGFQEWSFFNQTVSMYDQLNAVASSDPTQAQALEIYRTSITEFESRTKEAREFWLELIQVSVLVFFPILTALLGYIFGKNQG